MKKICFVTYDMSARGGVEQVTTSIANALVNDYEVYIVSLSLEGELAYTLDERIRFVSFFKQKGRLREMRKKTKPILSKFLQENRIDVAILQGHYPAFIASSVRMCTKTKLVFCDHGAIMNQWTQKGPVLLRLIASLSCHKTVTLTESSRDAYVHKLKISRKKVICIYNWVDLAGVHSEQYNADSKRIVSAGRFGKEKGFDMLIKAFTPVAQKHPDWHLDIFGDGEMMETVQGLVNEYDIADTVHLMGMRTDLAERYGEYAMYVLPSYREGMPLVLLEAKANRLPIVSFDIVTGPREIVRDGVDGILIEPYNLEKMGEAMCQLIEDDNLRKSMSESSQENLNTFSKDVILSQWKNLIETV